MHSTLSALLPHPLFIPGDTVSCSPVAVDGPEQQKTTNTVDLIADSSSCSSDQGRQQRANTSQAEPQEGKLVDYYSILGRTSVDILKSSGYKVSALQVGFVCFASCYSIIALVNFAARQFLCLGFLGHNEVCYCAL